MAEGLMRLSCAAVDTRQTIKWCFVDRETADILASFGLVQGAAIQVISVYSGYVIIAVNKKRIALERDIASRITI